MPVLSAVTTTSVPMPFGEAVAQAPTPSLPTPPLSELEAICKPGPPDPSCYYHFQSSLEPRESYASAPPPPSRAAESLALITSTIITLQVLAGTSRLIDFK